MKFDWNVYDYDYNDKVRNLDSMAKGVVKSNKFFPVFLENGKEVIFKPLSKTKPFSTPYFAYSEVFWSTVIKNYFDHNTPIYKLAICKNIDKDFENKYHHGTVVDSLVTNNEKLVNLYEIFKYNPDHSVNIDEYVNYCEEFYDYRGIFMSKFIRENKEIADSLAMQNLISMLKLDQNYHYENVLFKEENGVVKSVSPMIDHEFSTMFLHLDNLYRHKKLLDDSIFSLTASKDDVFDLFSHFRYEFYSTLSNNLDVIVSDYKDVSIEFLEKLKKFIIDLKHTDLLLEDHGYLVPFNSDNYLIGQALFKENDLEKAKNIKDRLQQYNLDIKDVNSIVRKEVLLSSEVLEQEIEKRLLKK